MSDPKRANLITVGAPKSAKKNVTQTVRLTINLDESNESKYSELNYKELVIAEDRKKKVVVNGKQSGLDPFSDNDDDVERVAKKFEQKYGGKSTYGKKGRSKHDDFADIGAGYDENDSFIDNTDGYDEMIPPECDTLHGGFYINCGSLEFKSVPENQPAGSSDTEPNVNRRNKRRISSSSSSEDSSDTSSVGSESRQGKEKAAVVNGITNNSHNTEHRKKKNKKSDKNNMAKKIRLTDSSAANSGKQTSDDNNHCEAESADSRTSQSDSLTSKPAPSSENAVTSDSSRDIENKEMTKLPPPVAASLEELQTIARRSDNTHHSQLDPAVENCLIRLERGLAISNSSTSIRRVTWCAAALALNISRTKLLQRVKTLSDLNSQNNHVVTQSASSVNATQNKRKLAAVESEDFTRLTSDEREAKLIETIQKLKDLIELRKPDMLANYKAECARVQEERKKLQIGNPGKSSAIEKRLPKRRFPWCVESRGLLTRVVSLCGRPSHAARLLHARVLPLFPRGFLRMPTLLRQAQLSKELKGLELKHQHQGSNVPASQQPTVLPQPAAPLPDPIHFPSSLTVTTTSTKPMDKPEPITTQNPAEKFKADAVFGSIMNSFSISKDLILEPEKRDTKKDENNIYVPPNNIGSITITPVPNQVKDKKTTDKHKEGLIRVKSPAALNEMVKRDKKKVDKIKDNKETPLHIDVNYQPKKTNPSPKVKEPTVSQKQIENMRVAENNIPRPTLIPVHSPTFAKPDKRPPEVKKKKDIVIISDVDPLSDINQEPLSVDDSSSDIEVIEEKSDRIQVISEVKSDSVPFKVSDCKVSDCKRNDFKSDTVKDDRKCEDRKDQDHMDIDMVMRNLLEMEKRTTKHLEQSQRESEVSKVNSNSHSSSNSVKSDTAVNSRCPIADHRSDKDKLTELTSLSRMGGCSRGTDKSSKP